jgi:hypothetical protein
MLEPEAIEGFRSYTPKSSNSSTNCNQVPHHQLSTTYLPDAAITIAYSLYNLAFSPIVPIFSLSLYFFSTLSLWYYNQSS